MDTSKGLNPWRCLLIAIVSVAIILAITRYVPNHVAQMLLVFVTAIASIATSQLWSRIGVESPYSLIPWRYLLICIGYIVIDLSLMVYVPNHVARGVYIFLLTIAMGKTIEDWARKPVK